MHSTRFRILMVAGTMLAGPLLALRAGAIANGTPVPQTEYAANDPWLAAIVDPGTGDVCAAELISPTYLITAAHCASTNRLVYIGNTNRTVPAPRTIVQAINNPNYNIPNTGDNDVALLQLASPVYGVAPVPVITQAQENTYVKNASPARIAGWGTIIGGGYPASLYGANIALYGLALQQTWIAYWASSGGPCDGDSGGPMTVAISGGGTVLAGLANGVSSNLCAPGPGIATYARLTLSRTWIVNSVPDLGQTAGIATADLATTTESKVVDISILANDLGFSDPVTVSIVTSALHGTAVAVGSPGPKAGVKVTYTPAAGYSGGDTFSYSVTDGTSTSTAAVSVTVLPDADQDGISDFLDNCLGVYNPDQRDTDGDGFGNMCDPDFDNNGIVNINDLLRLKNGINVAPADPNLDLNGDGAVSINDLNRLRSYLGKPPGPAAQPP